MKTIQNVFTIILLLLTGQVYADTLLIEAVEKNASVERPARGTTMKGVESAFGTPIKKHSAVGEPPISKWVYNKVTVYFEREYVIHSVVNRKTAGHH